MTRCSPRRPARVLIVAAAGYGKSTALAAALPAGGRLLSAAEALDSDLAGAPAWGVDDLDLLAPRDQVALVGRLNALPPEVVLTMASRSALDPEAQARLRGHVLERGPQDLALSPHDVARTLAAEHGLHDPEAAERIHDLSAGWPALVHLAADHLARDPAADLLAELSRPGSAAATWVASEVLSGVPQHAARVVGVVAELGPITQPVLDRVAAALGVGPVDGTADLLGRLGVLVDRRRTGTSPRQVVVPAVARVLAAGSVGGPGALTASRAAAWAYEDVGLPLAAAQAHARVGDLGSVERLVEAHGERMLRQGDAAATVGLLADPALAGSSDLVRRTYADALRLAGDAPAALRTFGPLIEAAGESGWPVGLATRVAAVHHTLGDYRETLATLELADGPVGAGEEVAGGPGEAAVEAAGEAAVEHVEWLAFRVRAMAMVGRREEARPLAVATLAAAERAGEPRALAAAHLAMARVTDGARKEAHHERARLAAEDSGDAVTTVLVLVNQSHLLLASARFAEAAITGREVVRLSATCSPPGRRVAALHNLAEALTRQGEYDEATWHLRRAVALARRLGPGAAAVGLLGLADIHRERGHDEQAHAAYGEAVELARLSGESQVLVPALSGLAQLLAPADPTAALASAQEADGLATASLTPFSRIALGRVFNARGDLPRARAAAAAAITASRELQAFDLLAEALELGAECAASGEDAVALLREALAIWSSGGAAPAVARIEALLGGMATADATTRSHGRDAARRLEDLGLGPVDTVTLGSRWVTRTVGVQVLGGFQVAVDGDAIPLTAWRSRQARTLVKILAARRGRPVPRSTVCEELWPEDDPARTGHRLSVLLATVRGVLDPAKRRPPEWYVASDQRGLWLDLQHVWVDADDLIRDAGHGAGLIAAGEEERGVAILGDVDRRYAGDAFEDDPDESWADALREEARAAWVSSARHLVSLRSRSGRAVDSHRLLVRLLSVDPYDEQAHRLLVRLLTRTGRHGEARRAFDRWAAAMHDIDAPAPDPDVLHRPATARVGLPPRAPRAPQQDRVVISR